MVYGDLLTSKKPKQAQEHDIEGTLLVQGRQKYSKSSHTQWKRNPFTLESAKLSGSQMILQGIVWVKEGSKAIINEAIAGIGDTVKGVTILEIKKDKAIVFDGTSNIELYINQPRKQDK